MKILKDENVKLYIPNNKPLIRNGKNNDLIKEMIKEEVKNIIKMIRIVKQPFQGMIGYGL